MADSEWTEAEIRADLLRLPELAALVVESLGPLSDVEFGPNRASVAWVEGYIERERDRRGPDAEAVGTLNALGAFLGECIRAEVAADWLWDDFQQDWGLALAAGGRVFPIWKVHKQYRSGLAGGESILSFYDVVVDYLAKGKLPVL